MNEKKNNKKRIIILWLTMLLLKSLKLYLLNEKKKRSLYYRNLVSKNTDVLNIYTKGYVDKDKKSRLNSNHEGITNVTTILKPTIFLKILSKIYGKEKLQRKIISEYIKEMNDINEDATVIIHVASEKEKKSYLELRNILCIEKGITQRIRIVTYEEEFIFED